MEPVPTTSSTAPSSCRARERASDGASDTPSSFQPSPQASEPASLPSAVPDLERGLTSSSACAPGPELQSVRPPPFLGIVTPALNIETEPPPAPEATCHWCIAPEHQLHEMPGLTDFPPTLVAKQLPSKDAVTSWPSGRDWGRLFLLLSSAPDLPFPDVGSYGRGPSLSSITYQPHQPVQFLKLKLSLSSCRLWR
ncbi:diacylglycerol kinase kappa-like [Canis lupus familiaris]|uniref:diacylglycerol kinase kappa-like n=1 Tax=Canis lupus familiaris TaxID=9615 RepID=UPI0003AE74ED|nr:diacylglycerol kinase kappa-like [Canis lupus familiaris]XP_022277362.1 diacylglycerol kinase kappa-like [Canis lupus familiaris]|eukprot:XP_005623160.1 diacylglycerol kinase kappa-like [Canis lupus familiaris]